MQPPKTPLEASPMSNINSATFSLPTAKGGFVAPSDPQVGEVVFFALLDKGGEGGSSLTL